MQNNISSILLLLYCIALISTASKTVMELMVNIFDFWFKFDNTVLLITASSIQAYVIRNGYDTLAACSIFVGCNISSY